MTGSFLTTANFGLRRLLGTSKGSDIDEGFQRLAEDVDSKMVGYSQDTLAKRPAAGIPNRLFKATDTGALYHDTGTAWEALVLAKGPTIISWGDIGSAAEIFAGSGDFTVTRTSTGVYDIVWNAAKPARYAVVATMTGTASFSTAALTVRNIAIADFQVEVLVSGNLSNQPFSFIAVSAS